MTQAPSIPQMPTLGAAFDPRAFCETVLRREDWLDGRIEIGKTVFISEKVAELAAPDSITYLLRLHSLGLWRAVNELEASFLFEGSIFEEDPDCTWAEIQEESHLLDGRLVSVFQWGKDHLVIWSQTSADMEVHYKGEDCCLTTEEPSRITFVVTVPEYSNGVNAPGKRDS